MPLDVGVPLAVPLMPANRLAASASAHGGIVGKLALGGGLGPGASGVVIVDVGVPLALNVMP